MSRLNDIVARRIAAGEVIDRPAAVVRELIDNALDAGADTIELSLRQGGLEEIRVTDNGRGMTPEDLKLCFLPHTTSKISAVEDLYRLQTLGFRGEALASMAACARLEIVSRRAEAGGEDSSSGDSQAWRLSLDSQGKPAVDPVSGSTGTAVTVKEIFFAMPGRKNFLKNPGAEAALCRQTLIEKALSFPDVAFRYFQDDKLKLFLPPSDPVQRIAAAYPARQLTGLLHHRRFDRELFSLDIVGGTPSLFRRDRKQIGVYINQRSVAEYALVQAVEYGYGELLPGGQFPVCFLFLELDPELVDFNIHPAKKEIRLRKKQEIHREVVAAVREFLSPYRKNPSTLSPQNREDGKNSFGESGLFGSPSAPPQRTPALSPAAESPRGRSSVETPRTGESRPSRLYRERSVPEALHAPRRKQEPETAGRTDWDSVRAICRDRPVPSPADSPQSSQTPQEPPVSLLYHGTLFGFFLLIEQGDTFYLIDQHAAHERILFEEFRTRPPESQPLLVPYRFEVSRDEETSLEALIPAAAQVGVELARGEDPGTWELRSVPAILEEYKADIVALILDFSGDSQEWQRALYARASCHRAVKDGDRLDSIAALELAEQALALPVPRCPHGRPIWIALSRRELLSQIKRAP